MSHRLQKKGVDDGLLSFLIEHQKLNIFFNTFFQYSNAQIAILDQKSKFLCLNQAYSKIIGYKNSEDVLGLSYEAFRSEASEKAEVFANQDSKVLLSKQPLEFLSYHQYADGKWHLLYGEKNSLIDKNDEPFGVFSCAKDVSNHGLFDISRFLINDNLYFRGKLKQEAFTYYIEHVDFEVDCLTKREKECLFFFIRGKTTQNIATILNRSKRTVEMHLESIKLKFDVLSKPELIEKAILKGYLSMLPNSLFQQLK
jgi:PAS domain S-box-containing protein